MRISIVFFMGVLICSLFSCESGRIDIKPYYFPLDSLAEGGTEGKVYEYRPLNGNGSQKHYWFYKTYVREGTRYLTGVNYDAGFNIQQMIREEVASNGMLLADFRVYAYDTLGNTKMEIAKVAQTNVFPFEVKEEGGIFIMEIVYTDPTDSLQTMTMVRNRHFEQLSEYSYKNKNYECAEFLTNELYEIDHKEDGFLEYKGTMKELYARDVGLIYYKKEINERITLEYELFDVYSMDEFLERQNE